LKGGASALVDSVSFCGATSLRAQRWIVVQVIGSASWGTGAHGAGWSAGELSKFGFRARSEPYQRERNLRFLSLWNPFLPFPESLDPSCTVDSTGRLTDDLVATHDPRRRPMELFAKLFNSLLVLVYHCFDRIVIHNYLSGLSRPEQVVFFFRQVLAIPVLDKEVLSRCTNDYQAWVEAYARNHHRR